MAVWDRQPGETPKAWRAFLDYRDMGLERSLAKLVQVYGSPPSYVRQLQRWSARYDWVGRAAAWDDYIAEVIAKKRLDDIQAMNKRYAGIAVLFTNKVVERLQHLDPMTLTPTQMAHWVQVASQVERLARGQPSAINEDRVRLDKPLEELTLEELEHILQQRGVQP